MPPLTNILYAVFITLLFAGPALVLFIISWRSLIAAALILAAIAIGMFTLFGVLMSAGFDMKAALFALVAGGAAALALGAAGLFLLRKGFAVNGGAAVLGIVFLTWAWMGKQHISNVWEFVGTEKTPWKDTFGSRPKVSYEKMDQQSADGTVKRILAERARAAAHVTTSDTVPPPAAPPDTVVALKDLLGQIHDVELTPERDIVSLGRIGNPTKSFLKLIHDPQMARWMAGRELIGVIDDNPDSWLRHEKGFEPMLHPGTGMNPFLMTPAFYDAASGTFSTGVYRWMRDVLQIPQPQRDELYVRYYDILPT